MRTSTARVCSRIIMQALKLRPFNQVFGFLIQVLWERIQNVQVLNLPNCQRVTNHYFLSERSEADEGLFLKVSYFLVQAEWCSGKFPGTHFKFRQGSLFLCVAGARVVSMPNLRSINLSTRGTSSPYQSTSHNFHQKCPNISFRLTQIMSMIKLTDGKPFETTWYAQGTGGH